MAGREELESQLTQVITTMAQGAEVSVQHVGGAKRHQIIIDIKQDIDMDEVSTRSLAESVMESLGARSAAVYVDSAPAALELTTVNVIVADELRAPTPPAPADDAPAAEPATTAAATMPTATVATTTASGTQSYNKLNIKIG
ncbi:myc-associated zinc finger protein-like [Aricia agestis]|uniref:myc-associated zinc finger protein-like n=1 Tax=Aricia agestis TaxID=91739 RepID=UPI001C209D1E|nr:myc-associated zinc finger protein-like [Aricia agestis]